VLLLAKLPAYGEIIVFDPQQIWATRGFTNPNILEPLYLKEGNTYVFKFYRLRDTYTGNAYNPAWDWTSFTRAGANGWGFSDCFVKIESADVTDPLGDALDSWKIKMIKNYSTGSNFIVFSSQENNIYNSFREDPQYSDYSFAGRENNWISEAGYPVDASGSVEIEILSGGGFLTGLSWGLQSGTNVEYFKNLTIPIPEPSSFSLLLAGGAVLMAGRRRK